MDTILQMTFSNAFSWMNGLALNRREAITWSNDMMVSLLMHICVTQSQRVKGSLLFWIKLNIFCNCIPNSAIITENNTHNGVIHIRSFALLHSEWYVYHHQMYLYQSHIAIYMQYIAYRIELWRQPSSFPCMMSALICCAPRGSISNNNLSIIRRRILWMCYWSIRFTEIEILDIRILSNNTYPRILVKSLRLGDTYTCQIMTCYLLGAKPLLETNQDCCQMDIANKF